MASPPPAAEPLPLPLLFADERATSTGYFDSARRRARRMRLAPAND
eukprot:COSAG04_NODE_30790_length_260_cov_1.273292_1_plen_45_part_01